MVEVVRQIRPHVRPLIDLIKSKIATMRAKKAHMNGAVMNGMTENEIDRPKDETDTMIRKEEKKVMFQVFNIANAVQRKKKKKNQKDLTMQTEADFLVFVLRN